MSGKGFKEAKEEFARAVVSWVRVAKRDNVLHESLLSLGWEVASGRQYKPPIDKIGDSEKIYNRYNASVPIYSTSPRKYQTN